MKRLLNTTSNSELLEHIFSVDLDPICIIDSDGNILKANAVWESMFGYREDELEQMNFLSLIHPNDIAVTQAAFDRNKKNEKSYSYINRIRCADGTYRDVEWRSHTYNDYIYAAARDITQLKKTEHELKTARANMKAMLDNQPYAAFLKDSNGRFVDVNRAFLDSYGLKREELIGKTDSFIWPDEIVEKLKAENDAILQSRKKISREEWNPEGTRCYERFMEPVIDPAGNTIGMTGFSRDITDRKKLELEILSQKAFLQQMLNSIPDLIFYKDTNYVYLGANKAFAENFLGVRQEDIPGKTDYDFCDNQIVELLRQLDRDVLETGLSKSTEENIRMANGRTITVETQKAPFYDDNGNISGFIGVSRDVTGRRQVEEKLKENEIELTAAKAELESKNASLQEAYNQLQIIAASDPLTKLQNRWSILNRLEHEQAQFRRSRRAFSVIITDIDDFKSINDTYGHNFGDRMLISVAQILRTNVRAQDDVARWGGEEFLIFLPDTGSEGAAVLAEKLRSLIEQNTCHSGSKSSRVTMTFGISVYDKTQPLDHLISKADKALYFGKENGKNRVDIA
jgi:diguanylate cyclase (GGDEF)-like protein/PAS domain S-box-containing protein